MATFVKFQSFVEAVAEGKHNLATGVLTVALCNAANAPSASADAVLADVTTIAYTNLSSRVITTTSSAQTSGTYKLVVEDLTLTASGGAAAAFRYVLIFNDTATNDELIGYYDYGVDVTLAEGEHIDLDFSATNGLLQLV